ncbi:MAG TPA: hypothetical protein VL284_06890 [Thermoanaerobaculia bacterium]|nr:hypothetical protein [Thermoanaerobaculia bacterium]
MTVSIAAVIPTRNRPALAMKTVASLLEQQSDAAIFLSDNSTSPGTLSAFCGEHPAVRYCRPPGELAIAPHWDWAVRRALEQSAATHFLVHRDRTWWKNGSLQTLIEAAGRWPDSLLTFGADSITDTPPPLRLWQMPWTGRGFDIRSARVASLIAAGRVAECAHALPNLAAALVPRAILESIAARFGDVCNSTGPDVAFVMRFLALYDSYVHLDVALAVVFAPQQSTTLAAHRGEPDAAREFAQLDAAPIPHLNLGYSILFHEYQRVRRLTGHRLPPLDHAACVNEIAKALPWIPPPRRAAVEQRLRAEGWSGRADWPPAASWLRGMVARGRLLRAHFGVAPETISGVAFRTDSAALEAALRYPRRRQATHEHMTPFEPRSLGPM